MNEIYIIFNDITDLYYHSFDPSGYPLWISEKHLAQYMTEETAEHVKALISLCNSGYQNSHIKLVEA